MVACGVGLLCGLPVIVSALPVPASSLTAAALRARILASADAPYQGYAESSVDLGLPALPDLGDVSTLLDGITDQEAWYRSPTQWRADVLTSAGETDTYQTSHGTFVWDYSSNLMTQILGTQPVRLPRAADLLPPNWPAGCWATPRPPIACPGCRRSGWPGWPRPACGWHPPTRRPRSARSTSGPIRPPACPSRSRSPAGAQPADPDRPVLRPEPAPSLARDRDPEPGPGRRLHDHRAADISGIANGFGAMLPARIAGMPRAASPGGLADVAAYGVGFSRFAVLPLPYGVGERALSAAGDAGAEGIDLASGTGALMQTPLLTVLLAQAQSGGPVYLLTGTVTAALLVRAATDLLNLAEQQQS